MAKLLKREADNLVRRTMNHYTNGYRYTWFLLVCVVTRGYIATHDTTPCVILTNLNIYTLQVVSTYRSNGKHRHCCKCGLRGRGSPVSNIASPGSRLGRTEHRLFILGIIEFI